MTLGLLAFALVAADAPGVAEYLDHIRPLLHGKCVACHGPLRQNGKLRLDTAELARHGGKGGPGFVPGKPEASRILHALAGQHGLERMPPEGPPLAAAEIDRLRQWIAAGAPAAKEIPAADPKQHWSFKPLAAPPVPPIPAGGNAIDGFLHAARRSAGAETLPNADRPTLLRRVSLDLTGLPPTPAEVAGFVADPRPDAYEREVDRLLASPRYGERWGRHWMDVWRYSDWAGYGGEHRESQKHIWHWRDWIVESLNADRGYDQMVLEMLAADELRPGDPLAARATGFLARNWYKFNRNAVLDNTVEHVGKAFLGLTFNCARCHDHMYDPISQIEHYRFRAFFQPHEVRLDRVPAGSDLEKHGLPRVYDGKPAEPTRLLRRGNEKEPDGPPLEPAPPAFLAAGMPKLAATELPRAAWLPDLRPEIVAAFRRDAQLTEDAAAAALKKTDTESNRTALAWRQAQRVALEARIAADAGKHAEPPVADLKALAQAAARAEKAAAVADQRRQFAAAKADLAKALTGVDPAKVAKAVAAAAPKFAALDQARAAAEAALAKPGEQYAAFAVAYPKASTGRRSALARWIVAPENPLAARVAVNHLWLRHFGAPLVPTVFDFGRNGQPPIHPALLDHLASELRRQGWRMKPLHRLLVTSSAYRLATEFPPEHPNVAKDRDNRTYWRMNPRRLEGEAVRDAALAVAGRLDLTMGGPDLDHETGLATFRRSLYYRHAPEKRMLFLATFDAANAAECYRRNESVAPQQALALANGPLTRDSARALAPKLGAGKDDPAFVEAAFAALLCRAPRPDERAAALAFLKSAAPAEPPRAALLHVLLNHHDFIVLR